jgi:hypothetical protein
VIIPAFCQFGKVTGSPCLHTERGIDTHSSATDCDGPWQSLLSESIGWHDLA